MMIKDQSQTESIRQRDEMVKRVLTVAELLAKSSELTLVNLKTTHKDKEKTRDAKPVVSS